MFEWVGYQLVKYKRQPRGEEPEGPEAEELIPLIRLKVKNPATTELPASYVRPSDAFLQRRGANIISRTWTPSGLHRQFQELRRALRSEANQQGQPFPATLKPEVPDRDFEENGFLDISPHPYATNLYERPIQDTELYSIRADKSQSISKIGLRTQLVNKQLAYSGIILAKNLILTLTDEALSSLLFIGHNCNFEFILQEADTFLKRTEFPEIAFLDLKIEVARVGRGVRSTVFAGN
jgi:hypothetical protein